MKQTITHNGINIVVSTNEGIEVIRWDLYRYKYTITITANGTSKRFLYYGSHREWQEGKNTLQEQDVNEAVACIFMDAISYMYNSDISAFAKEFGYTDIKDILKAYNGCKSTYNRVKELGFTDDDICSIDEMLNS